MRILILPSWYPDESKPLNGIFFKEQAEALKKAGVEVIVLNIKLERLFSNIQKGLTVNDEEGIKVYRYKTYNYFPKLFNLYIKSYGYFIKKIIKKIEDENGKIDLIHIHSAFDAGIAYANSNLDIPYIITEHSSRYHRNIINNQERKLLPKVFEKSKKNIAVSKGLKSKIDEFNKNKDTLIIPNMVTKSSFKYRRDENKKKFRFFSLAFLNIYKGMDVLIEAFRINKEEFKDVELYIGGNGPEYDKLKEMIKTYGLENSIILLGELNREEVKYNMSNCDIFVLASRVETFGIVFLEAMIEGKPVIGCKTGGPDTFITREVGEIVDIDDTKALAEAMLRGYKNYSKYDENFIREYCENNFSEEEVSKKLIKLYSQVIGDKYEY